MRDIKSSKCCPEKIVRALSPNRSIMPASLMISGLVPNTTATDPASKTALSGSVVTRSPATGRPPTRNVSGLGRSVTVSMLQLSIERRAEVKKLPEIPFVLERERAEADELKRYHQGDSANHVTIGSGLVRETDGGGDLRAGTASGLL